MSTQQLPKKKRIGKYLLFLQEQLGSGAFAKVYKGIDETTQQVVAIKCVNRQTIQQDQYTKNAFISEIQIMKNLKSRNIIQFLDVHETKHNFYIIQELANGGTLRQKIKGKILSTEDAINYMVQILNGFGQMVKNGIIHRDIKPENILIKDNLLKIADFGFAKQSDNNAFMKTIIGTPLYMSPQILGNEPYTYKCDIWALGVLFYQFVVGKAPWPLKDKNMLNNIKNAQIIFIPELNIPESIKQFIKGCLAYKQQDRYDWEQVYLHPLFANIFKQNFENSNQYPVQLSFFMSNLRMSVHSQNLDITKLLQKLPDNLNEQNLFEVLSLMMNSITKGQSKLVFVHCQKIQKIKNKSILVQTLQQFLSQNGIRMKSLDFSQMLKQSQIRKTKQQTQSSLLVSRLKRKMEEKQIDIYELYRQQDKDQKNALQLPQFKKLVLKIQANFNNEEIEMLFKEFDTDKNGDISFHEFYRTLCKIAGVVQSDPKKASILKKKL